MNLRKVYAFFLAAVIVGCASSPPESTTQSNEDNGVVVIKQTPILIQDLTEAPNPRIEELRSEIQVLDGQIVQIDSMIQSSRAQMDGYRSINAEGAETLAEKAQQELMSYEVQRTHLIGKRAKLQSELNELTRHSL